MRRAEVFRVSLHKRKKRQHIALYYNSTSMYINFTKNIHNINYRTKIFILFLFKNVNY